MKKLSLQEVLEGIEDTRRERSVWYPLYEVLIIMLTAVICGATSYAKVELFGKSKEKWLKKYLKLENGVPDACTFRNVITAIPQLLEMLEIKGCIVTIDAMGTQTEIAKKITEKGADYLLALKENQKTLYEDVRLFFEEYRTNPTGIGPECHAESHSQGHGRYESRTCYVCEDIGWLAGREKWIGLAGIGVIFCKVEQNESISEQAHYFLYSRKGMTANQALEAKRSHWSIENGLHWVLDMQLREDESRARADNSAENLNVLRHWAYNILKAETSMRGSFSDKQFKCLLDDSFLDKILRFVFCS